MPCGQRNTPSPHAEEATLVIEDDDRMRPTIEDDDVVLAVDGDRRRLDEGTSLAATPSPMGSLPPTFY